MTTRITALEKATRRIGDWWGRWAQILVSADMRSKHPRAWDRLEGEMQLALTPVRPSPGFREGLRSNLTLAAQRRMSDLVIEYPKPYRQGIILGVSAGLLAATIAAVVLVFHSRMASAGR